MFLIDVSPSMGKLREVELSDCPEGETRTVEMTNLQWSLRFVLLKIQEMVCWPIFTSQTVYTNVFVDLQRS